MKDILKRRKGKRKPNGITVSTLENTRSRSRMMSGYCSLRSRKFDSHLTMTKTKAPENF
jgi:hypothetical protein